VVVGGDGVSSVRAAGGGGRTPARYLVLQIDPDGTLRPVFSTRVTLRSPLRGNGGARLPARRDSDAVRVRLEDQRRAVVFEDTVEIPRWIRGEFHGEPADRPGAYTIDGHHILERSPTFVVRVPDIAGAALTLDSPRLTAPARLALDELDADPALARSAPRLAPPPLPGWTNGDPTNRLDILVMGDGYTTPQQAQFETNAIDLANAFFGLTPYLEYRNYANVRSLFTPSAQSGIDQPPYDHSCAEYARMQTCCGDAAATGTTPANVATAFDGTFCSFDTQRLATVDFTKVYIAASADPDWDEIFVLVNSTTYGGSGGAFAVVSLSPSTIALAQHEFAHVFMHLADEYADPAPAPPCSDLSGSAPCEANVTDQTSRPSVKWNRWIASSQPVPSSGAAPQVTAAGLWEGARYLPANMYRQGFICIMKNLGAPFCDVAAETFPLRLYGGGWGDPAGGIDEIEPGSESPAPGSVDRPYPGGAFSATVLGPADGPAVTAEWLVDGDVVATQALATGATASHALATTIGPHTLELRVTDESPILHPTMRAGVASSRTWNVSVGLDDCGNGALDPGEGCDDGDLAGGDGCGQYCAVETCWQCAGAPSVCAPTNGAACSSGDACLAGESCTGTVCSGGSAILSCATGDDCCPAGCTAGNDLDCAQPPATAITGRQLLVKDDDDPSRRKLTVQSKDPTLDSSTGTGIDPVTDGASLQLYNANGGSESVCFQLPSAGWRATGTAPLLGYKYKDTAFAHGPCKAAMIKHGKLLKVQCDAKVQPIAYSLNEPAQGVLAVRFTSGTRSFCATFGGTVRRDSGTDPPIPGGRGQFSAKDAPLVACPPAPPCP